MRASRPIVPLLLLVLCASALAPPAAAHETVVVTEVTTAFVPTDVPPTGASVGDAFRFTADLLAGGAPAGTSEGGSVTIARSPDGTLTGSIGERLRLVDGTILAFGRYDQTALRAGVPQTIQAVGIDGAYRGRRGTLTNTPVEPGVATLTIVLD